MAGCSDRGQFKGKTYSSYGIIDESKLKNPDVRYEVNTAALVISTLVLFLLSSTIGLIALFVTVG